MTEWYYDVNVWIAFGTMITASGTIIAVYWTRQNNKEQLKELHNQLKNNEKQLFASNFGLITQDVGTKDAVKDRQLLYNCHKERTELLANYQNRKSGSKPDLVNEAGRKIASMYDRIGFLLAYNPELRPTIIDFHGYTIGRLWKIIEPIHDNLWKEIDKQRDYREFRKLGEECYEKYRDDIDIFLRKNQLDMTSSHSGSPIK